MHAVLVGLAVSLAVTSAVRAQSPMEQVDVVGRTPLGAGVRGDQVASNYQLADSDNIRDQRALDLTDFMKRNLASVFVNEAQSNPLQPDVQYRGFVGSPLLGLPQGIAVYQDGVRVNEPFGDTVNWALIPESAIETMYLIPGSNPLFGLNALGGAIAIETKNGFSSEGTDVEVYGGSFSRVGVKVETGGSVDDRFSYFVAGSYLDEDGWRDFSPTRAMQLFANAGWQNERTSLDLNLTRADTDLIGNGPAPAELLAFDRKAIFTRPDRTRNELTLVNLKAEHEASSSLTLTGNVYVRRSDIHTFNGDDSDFEECADDPGFLCGEEVGGEALVLDANDNAVAASAAVEGAVINRTNTEQDGSGFGFQANWVAELGGRDNVLVAGVARDRSAIGFDSSAELGRLDETRLAIPSGFFVGDSFTRLGVETSTAGVYLSDTLSLSDAISVTVSGRYNAVNIELHDRLGTALDGKHRFGRFNPAISVTAGMRERVRFYAGYSESNRAPSPIELTCADPNDPCRLPNAFLADPPLEQVVAKTIEAGLRGMWEAGAWHAGLFRTVNRHDILFISAGALTNEGFFDNVGRTRRDGIELNLDGEAGPAASWFVNYTYLDATFRERLVVPSPNNPAAVGGVISVQPGDRLPLIPRSLLKTGFRVAFGDRATVGGEFLAGSSFRMRGDEGNDFDAIGGYRVLNLRGEYVVNDRLRLFLNVDNVLDRSYETFGLFGDAGNVLGPSFGDPRFLSPSSPRAAWLGVHIDL